MAVDHIRYDLLAQEALRGVVQRVLSGVAKNGLPGEHHFYIAIATRAPGVRLSARLLEQYPEEMTIVLQHQFWDLVVNNDGFEVGLSFGGIPERLCVPFAAIKGFFDPSVQFGLQFELEPQDGAAGQDVDEAPPLAVSPLLNQPEPQARGRAPVTAPPPSADATMDDHVPPDGGGEVVRLDRFRKKEGRGQPTEDGKKRR